MSKNEEVVKTEKELDCGNASRGVWLVKVPKYIAKKWEKGKIMKLDQLKFSNSNKFIDSIAPGDIEVGKLKIVKYPGQKSQVSLSLSEATLKIDPEQGKLKLVDYLSQF